MIAARIGVLLDATTASHSPFYSGTFHGITNPANSAWEGGLGYINQNNERDPNPTRLRLICQP